MAMTEIKTSETLDLEDANKILKLIGRNTFQHNIAQYLLPYERFLLTATCRWMSTIFKISSFDFNFHSASDLGVLKHAITDKYFNKQKTYRHCSNCVDLSNKIYEKLSLHEKLCIKYVLIFQDKLPEYFPVHSFQNFLDYSLKLTFSSNDVEYSDSIINLLYDIIVHEESCTASLITSLHLDNIGLNSFNHLCTLSNKILVYTHNIRYLYLADNPMVNDVYMEDLFLCIAANNHHLEILDLSNTSISNKTCDVIYHFCLSIYTINHGNYNESNYSSDNESNYTFTNDKESQTSSHDDCQEIIYMSSEETDGDDEDIQDTDFSTDDEFDNIVERKLINNNNRDYGAMDVERVEDGVGNEDEAMEGKEDEDEQEATSDDENDTEIMRTHNISVTNNDDDELPSVSMKISFTKIWIDLKHNKGITTDGVDRLNQIYVKKIEPSKSFVICVEGCCYEPNPKWDLSLL